MDGCIIASCGQEELVVLSLLMQCKRTVFVSNAFGLLVTGLCSCRARGQVDE